MKPIEVHDLHRTIWFQIESFTATCALVVVILEWSNSSNLPGTHCEPYLVTNEDTYAPLRDTTNHNSAS